MPRWRQIAVVGKAELGVYTQRRTKRTLRSYGVAHDVTPMQTPPRRAASPCGSPCGLMLVRQRMGFIDYLADFDPASGTMHLHRRGLGGSLM